MHSPSIEDITSTIDVCHEIECAKASDDSSQGCVSDRASIVHHHCVTQCNLQFIPLTVVQENSPPKKKKRQNRKRGRNPNNLKREQYNAQRDQERREATHHNSKAKQIAEAAERLTNNSIPTNPRIFARAEVVQSQMHPDLVRRQSSAFLAKPAVLDKLTPTDTHTCGSRSTASNSATSSGTQQEIHEKLGKLAIHHNAMMLSTLLAGLHKDCDPEIARLMTEEGFIYVKNVNG